MGRHEGGLTDAEKVADGFSAVSGSGGDADCGGRGLVQDRLFGGFIGQYGGAFAGQWNAAPGLVPAELIDSLYYPERDNGITRQAEDGKVTYWVDKDSASKIGSSNIQTILKLPEGTVSVICTDESGQCLYAINPPGSIIPRGNPSLTPEYPAQAGRAYPGRHCQHLRHLPVSGSKRQSPGGQRPAGQSTVFCTDDGKVCLDYLNDRDLAVHPRRALYLFYRPWRRHGWSITYQNGLARYPSRADRQCERSGRPSAARSAQALCGSGLPGAQRPTG